MSKKYRHDYERVVRFVGRDIQLTHICLNYGYLNKLNLIELDEEYLFYINCAKMYYKSTLIMCLMNKVDLFGIFNYSTEYYLKCMAPYCEYMMKEKDLKPLDHSSGDIIDYVHGDEGYCQVEFELIGVDNTLEVDKYIISKVMYGYGEKLIEYVHSEMDKGLSAQTAYEKAMDVYNYGKSTLDKKVDDLLDSL